MADAIILAMTGGSELLAKTQHKYFQQSSGYLSSIISAVVTEDWSQVVKNCDVDSWMKALAGAITHTNDEEFPVLCQLLGERLEESRRPDLIESAQLCYICAGNIDKLTTSLLSSLNSGSPSNLQNLVEKVMLLKKAVELQGKRVEVSGAIADLLSQYASILASQGSLDAAISYLGTAQEERLLELRDRLACSLGQKQAYPVYHQQTNQRRMSNQQPIQQPRTRTLSSSLYPTSQTPQGFPPVPQQPGSFPQPGPMGGYQQPSVPGPPSAMGGYQPPAPAAQPPLQQPGFPPGGGSFNRQPNLPPVQQPPVHTQPSSLQSPKMFSTQQQQPPVQQFNLNPMSSNVQQSAPPPQVAPPLNPSPGPAQGGLASRSKYVVDPSVQTGNNFGYNQLPPTPGGMMNQFPGQPVAPAGFPTQPAGFPTQPAGFPTQPAGFGQNFQPQRPPSVTNQGYPPEVFQPPPPASGPPPPQFINQAPPGWNDPPVFTSTPKNHPRQDVAPQNPILHPLFNPEPATQNFGMNGFNQQQHFQDNMYSQQPPQQQSFQQFPQQQQQQQQHQHQHQLPPQQQQQHPRIEKAIETPPPKKPIPEEHLQLQTVLDELVSRCCQAANNPQSKRKLDDVSRKLEVLYDNLRDNKLTNKTLQDLHEMMQFITNGDYQSGLMFHTQMVSGPDFSNISGFMPGVKVLLQSALQLQVYL